MEIKESDVKKMAALLESLSDIVYKQRKNIKPREADKARQARLMLKKLKRNCIINKNNKKI